ncbi:MAG: hypothetical protein P8J33_01590 [Pirellulaceae bacterium]|nr:hypothetical protein [Pirellulaceae bacterium]
MNPIRVTCPHCNQVLEVRESDVGKKLRCVKCHQAFKDEGALPVATVTYTAGQGVIKVRCQKCDDKFGLKPAMSEKSVACPHCKSRQKYVLTPRDPDEAITAVTGKEVFGKSDSEDETRQAAKPVVKKEAAASGRATVVHAKNAVRDEQSELTARARDLLPPRYTVADSMESQATLDLAGQVSTPAALEINTEITRIHHESGASAPIRSLSREQKGRRKNLRVAIIYIVSVIVLVVLCIVLVQSVGSEV